MNTNLSKINPNEQSTGTKKLKTGLGGFWVSVKTLSTVAILLGFFLMISLYLNISVLTKVYPDWTSMQFNILLGILLIAVGVSLALVVGLLFNKLRKGSSLQKKLEDEIDRRKKVGRDLVRVQEISKTGNWILELSSHKIQCSSEVCRILDCNTKNTAMSFEGFLKFVHPDDRVFVESEIQKTMSLEKTFNLTHRIVRRDGSIRIVKQRSEIYLDRKGEPTQIMGTLQDITEQKEAENLAARLDRIVDKSFNEIYIFDAETLKFTKVNLAARLNLRYSMEELYEMTPVDLKPEYTQEQFEKITNSLKNGKESVVIFETVYKRNNGTLYPVDVRLQLSRAEAHPQFVAIVQDISDRKKLENLSRKSHQDINKRIHERTVYLTKLNKELQVEVDAQKKVIEILGFSEHRLVEIMNNVADGIITIDEEGTIQSFNRAAEHLLGFKIDEALGQNINILMAGSDGVQDDEYFKNLLQSEKSAALGLRRVVTARKKDGTTFSAELAVNETVIGSQRMFIGLMRNLTEKEEMEHELMHT